VRILIATAGVLSPEPVVRFTERLVDEGGAVSVATVIEVPRSFLDEIRSEEWHPLSEDAPKWTTAEDAVIARYVEERGARLTEPLLAALRSAGVEADAMFLEGEDPAGTIIAAAEKIDADLVILGATKPLFDESSWESVSAVVMRDARRPVMVVPTVPRNGNGEDED
jgi:nucleotide-binding universal stress UspA family protein